MPAGDITGIQALLAERGHEVPRNGKLDDATKNALRRLEKQLDSTLRRSPKIAGILERRGWSISGAVLRPDGTVMDPAALRRLTDLADAVSSNAP